jgi:hypothetical protein
VKGAESLPETEEHHEKRAFAVNISVGGGLCFRWNAEIAVERKGANCDSEEEHATK